MKIALINPHTPLEVIYGRGFAAAGAVLPPLGILYLAAYIKNKNERKDQDKDDIEIIDANALKIDPAEITKYILENKFDCVGLSATTFSYPYAVEIAKNIRSASCNIRIIVGGPHAQASYSEILAEYPELFDFVCYGEGEVAFGMFLEYFKGNITKQEMLGWCYLENGKITTLPPAPIPDNLDIFGHPAEVVPSGLIPLYREKILAFKKLPMFSVITSRGCPFQCTFCFTPRKFSQLYNNKVRFHSVDWIIRELELLRDRYGVREVTFVDDAFNLKKERVWEFSQAMIDKGIKIPWSCNFEAHIVDREMMRKIKEAGCWCLMVGAESGSDKVLKFIKKAARSGQTALLAEIADSLGIMVRASFIIGLPTDTQETVETTINFAKRSRFHFPYFQLYVPFPGAAIFSQLADYGRVLEKDPKARSASQVNYIPQGLTQEYLEDAFKRAHKTVYLNRARIKSHLKFINSADDLRRYWLGLKLLFFRRVFK